MKEKILERGLSIFKSLMISFVLTIILIIIISILLTFTSLEERLLPVMNTIVMIISISFGSIYMVLKTEEDGWLNGGTIGILYLLILSLINYFFFQPLVVDVYLLGKFAVALVVGIIAGIIGVNIK